MLGIPDIAAYISERLSLLELPPKVQELLLQGQLSFSHAKMLSKMPKNQAESIAEEAAKNKTSLKNIKKTINETSQESFALNKQGILESVKRDIKKAKNILAPALTKLIRIIDSDEPRAESKLTTANESLKQAIALLEESKESIS